MKTNPFLPPATIGILGSGQLDRMFAIAIVGNTHPEYRGKLEQFRQSQTNKVLGDYLPSK